jgi:DNA (cytosine-5)-methyltransferase 1
MQVVDLFAGAGGLSLGASWADCHVEHALEADTWACETLRLNHPETRVHELDIAGVSDSWIQREFAVMPELIVGGPPCQGFSRAGSPRKDPRDPRNTLFREFVRFVRILEPRAFVMENVPGILRSSTAAGQSVAHIIRLELERLGYEVAVFVLNAELYGVPQIRRRVFFVGSLEGLPDYPPETHGEANLLDASRPQVRTLRDAIGDLPVVDVGFRGPTIQYVGPPENAYQRRMRLGSSATLENHIPMKHSARTVARLAAIQPGQSQSDVGAEHAPRRRVRREEDGVGTYDQNNRRMHWDRPCHTIAASFYANFVHPELHRNFTPREGARIQSFPDSYVFRGKPTVVSQKLLAREGRHAERHLSQYNQIGNAVPPLLAEAVIRAALRLSTRDDRKIAA